jgi:uncharacterized protein YbjT (DUF2867 family)
VLIIGATGMLGRPVARRLISEGFRVRAMVRDVDRARQLLPPDCELVKGDLRDAESLDAAMRGVNSVHINLSPPMRSRPPEWDPELHGTQAIIDAARSSGVKRLVRISAMGVDEASSEWWVADHKARADRALMDSGIAYTIVRPTWLMESLATMTLGRRVMWFNLPGSLRWLAGDDLARQVAAALGSDESANRIYHPQGPELLTLRDAAARFAAACGIKTLRVPMWPIRTGALFNGRMSYLNSLMEMTVRHFSRIDQQAITTDLPAATMTVEGYAQYMKETGDRPKK